jgi:hypothetical protein
MLIKWIGIPLLKQYEILSTKIQNKEFEFNSI